MKLSVIIPCYNERDTILQVVEKIAQLEIPAEMEIIVVDDGSDDGSAELLKHIPSARLPVTIISHEKNLGKGEAVATGARAARGEFLIVQDADFELNPRDYPRLLKPIINNQARVVFGSRRKMGYPKMYFHSRLGNHIVNLFTNLLFAARISDVSCGYKILPLALYRQLKLKCRRFEFCTEITAKLLLNKIDITEVAVNYTPRTYTQGKKVQWRDGFKALKTLFLIRFSRPNRRRYRGA
jgi:glycosyltransferase involved in cell wall biosynthesis